MTDKNNVDKLDMLAEQVIAGDAAAYKALLANVRPALKSYFLHQFRAGAAADDLTQETMLALHTKFHTYRPGSPFAPWLYAIAKYKAIDYLRANKRRTVATEVPLDNALVGDTPGSDVAHDLAAMLATLSTRDRTLVQMAKVEGHSVQHISEHLNISIAAVKVGLHRAMKRLMGAAAEEQQ